jgi:hypothetical protein
MKEARQSRYGHRDATLILIAFRHGLRAVEICDLEWSQVEFGRSAALHVRRVKNGRPSVHPLRGDEIRALRALRRQFPDSGYVFATERGGPFTSDAVNRLIKRIGERAGMPFQVHCTCYATAAAMPWPMQGRIRGLSRTGLATDRSSTRCGIPSLRRPGSRTIGGIDAPLRHGPKKRKFLNLFSRACGCACALRDVGPFNLYRRRFALVGGKRPSDSEAETWTTSTIIAQLTGRHTEHAWKFGVRTAADHIAFAIGASPCRAVHRRLA